MPNDTIISVENLGLPARRAYSPEGKSKFDLEWIVYAIENPAGRVHIGQTGDWTARLKAYNAGSVPSTKNGCPWTLIAMEKCASQSAARWLEFQLKRSRGSRTRWLQKRRIEP